MLRPTRSRDRRDQSKVSPTEDLDFVALPRPLVRMLEIVSRIPPRLRR